MGLDMNHVDAFVGAGADAPIWTFAGAAGAEHLAPSVSLRTEAFTRIRRTSSCACDSGLRYKHCCGWLTEEVTHDDTAQEMDVQVTLVRRAIVLMQRGEGKRASTLLQRLRPEFVADAWVAVEAGEMCIDLDLMAKASALLQRALELGGAGSRAVEALQECRDLTDRPNAWASARQRLRASLERLALRARPVANISHVHIVCKLDTIGGTETRALNLYRRLSSRVRTTLWSTTPVLAAHAAAYEIRRIAHGDVPSGGTLALVGTFFDCGDWLENQPFERVVICHNLATQQHSLENKLAQIESNPSRPDVRLTFPSALFKDTAGLPGRVEYSPVDIAAFRRDRPHGPRRSLSIGRHGRAHPMKFHPNDPAFFRAVMKRGHTVRILGGSQIAHFFANDRGAQPELLAVGAQSAKSFLGNLDVFVYRSHPHFFETGGTVILEAMAMELPVILFGPSQCGSTELIDHGENGFLVTTESAALEVIDRLTADAALRARVGHSARRTVEALMQQQAAAMTDYYIA